MFSLLKRALSPEQTDFAAILADEITQAARRTAFYTTLEIPDTLEARLDVLALHSFIFLENTKDDDELKPLAQDVIDCLFLNLDHGLRETGVSDTGVPKKMKLLAGQFYARLKQLEDAKKNTGFLNTVSAIFYAGYENENAKKITEYLQKSLAQTPNKQQLLQGKISFQNL